LSINNGSIAGFAMQHDLAHAIQVGGTCKVKASSIRFEVAAKPAQWQGLQNCGNAKSTDILSRSMLLPAP
jgi:hypothetical protein